MVNAESKCGIIEVLANKLKLIIKNNIKLQLKHKKVTVSLIKMCLCHAFVVILISLVKYILQLETIYNSSFKGEF